MTTTQPQRSQCARQLAAAARRVPRLAAFVGLDGFVDEILHVVDKRESATRFTRMPTIARLAERLAGAAGQSTNIELVRHLQKLGGNGPIMANALASMGLKVTYVGNLGWPDLHPVFTEFARRAEVHSIAPPGYTDALEFNDGKVMVGKHESLKEVTWENVQKRWSRRDFARHFGSADLVGFVNWTMLPFMSNVWEALLRELCPKLDGPRRTLFFDLADPEKRLAKDVRRALALITRFNRHFKVILGLNEKEAHEVAKALGLERPTPTPDALVALGRDLHRHVPVDTLVIHPVSYALAVSDGEVAIASGPVTDRPLITTGAGDHFNSGFCLGKLLGFDNLNSLLTGVTCSGYYVRSAKSPGVNDLIRLLKKSAVPY
ncbi:MAG TPA: hypothetical protein PKM73_01470 [Verrucomicrobiota bacterium]|nr:hypothetical protein [Verrucomicrobiota bacterium]HNU49337.1 hypothetical protein [Verrucomicrobiota bacterium]